MKTPEPRTYTTTQCARYRVDGDVTSNGVVFDFEPYRDGDSITLIREPHHKDADLEKAKEELRRTRKVVEFKVGRLQT